MDLQLERLVWLRADGVCEYCQVASESDPLPFCIDHIVAQKHHGATAEDNLALSCYNGNSYKGPNIAGIDPETGQLTRLFHPRTDVWEEHFEWNGAVLVGRTAVGRATVDVLSINHPSRIEHRQLLIAEGVFPRRRTE
ncbi:MAG: HNH endonuclease [Phycisphaerae bacterium]|nr:HNH endonuclease [Phycisphaerae bacterium]